jgi:hypothetical protein
MDDKKLAQHYKTLLQEVISVLSKKNPDKKTWIETKFDDINYQYEFGKLSLQEIKALSVDKETYSGLISIDNVLKVVSYTFVKDDVIRCVDKHLNVYFVDYSSLINQQ